MTLLFVLLVVFQFKHFFADYPLQGSYMLGKFKDKGWVLPLLAHVGVHGAFTLAICLVVAPHLWWLAIFDMVAHFLMDRLKAGKKYLGRFKALSASEFPQVMKTAMWEPNHGERDQLKIVVENGWKSMVHEAWKDTLAARARLKSNVYFWWALGLDQMVHHLTHYGIIAALVLL